MRRDPNILWYDLSWSLVLLRTRLLQGFVCSDLIESDSEPLLWYFATAILGEMDSWSNQEINPGKCSAAGDVLRTDTNASTVDYSAWYRK